MAEAETNNPERKIGLLMHALKHATPLSSLGTKIAQALYFLIREHNPTSAPYFLEALIQRFPHSVNCYFKQPSDPDPETLKVIAQFLQNPFIPPSLRESCKEQVMENLEELLEKIFQQPYRNVKDIAPWLLLIMQELGITEDQTVQKRCDCLRTIQHPHNPEAIQTCITKLKNGDYLTAIDSARAILKLDLSPEQRGAIIQLNNGKLPSLALLNATVAAYPSEITEEIARKIREICAFLNISNSDLYSDPLLILLSNTLASDEFHSQRPATNLTLEEFKEVS